jgi:hypothetical protein
MTGLGMGQHLLYLPNPTYSALQILKWNTIYQVVNVLGAFFTKLSIGVFLLRLKDTRRFTLSVWLILTPLALATVILCLTVLLQCIPLHALWEPTVKGRCIANTTPLTISYVQSGFAIITDLYLTVSPIVILWKVQISVGKKVAICALMSLGLMATIANALRNAFIPNLVESDFSCTYGPAKRSTPLLTMLFCSRYHRPHRGGRRPRILSGGDRSVHSNLDATVQEVLLAQQALQQDELPCYHWVRGAQDAAAELTAEPWLHRYGRPVRSSGDGSERLPIEQDRPDEGDCVSPELCCRARAVLCVIGGITRIAKPVN